ncbi:MAG: hypothetical protein OXF68_01365 [Gammaproteobacteria bacterium]|nr:hypothetical protein [Gammaproteobacteria bacterium]
MTKGIAQADLAELSDGLSGLIGVQLEVLRLPRSVLKAFEPSQIGTIVGTLMDACIPELSNLYENQLVDMNVVGLSKHEGILGEREGYPDYRHRSGRRLELKLLYRDPKGVEMKTPPTVREASARLTQKVTVKNVDPEMDVLMVLAYELRPIRSRPELYGPTIVDIGLFPMIDCILARDDHLVRRGGRWFGDCETPCVPSKIGREKLKQGKDLDETGTGARRVKVGTSTKIPTSESSSGCPTVRFSSISRSMAQATRATALGRNLGRLPRTALASPVRLGAMP